MAADPDLRNRVNIPRSTIPAVTHVDYSARIQTVDEARNPRLASPCCETFYERHRLSGAREHQLQRPRRADRLHARGRLPVLSLGTDMDALVLEDVIAVRTTSPERPAMRCERRTSHSSSWIEPAPGASPCSGVISQRDPDAARCGSSR